MIIRSKTLKKVKCNYDEVYTKFKKTEAIDLLIGDFGKGDYLSITTQQCGKPLDQPHVDFSTNGVGYSMDWDVFVKKMISCIN